MPAYFSKPKMKNSKKKERSNQVGIIFKYITTVIDRNKNTKRMDSLSKLGFWINLMNFYKYQ